MSGLLAILDLHGASIDAAMLARLTARLAELGPDGRKVWSQGNVGLGHALHRTTDEARREDEPVSLDGSTWIVSDARIDERTVLASRLRGAGPIPLGRTPDAELVLQAYERWGDACPAYLLGDFAFAIWDRRRRRLLCARDRFGMRQLYYGRLGGALVVSNSLWCLLGHPAVSRRLDEEAVGGFLLFGDHTWLDKGITAFADIRSVPPAHTLLLDGGRIEIRRYWDFPIEVPLLRYRRERDYVAHFRDLYRRSVADRMRTRSVVVAMSGGMDSSSMAAMARQIGANSGSPVDLRALTVLYDRIMPSEERRYAVLVAKHLGIPIHLFDGGDYPFLHPPMATPRPLELYNPAVWAAMFRAAAGYGRVLLHGEGGDSLLAYSSGLPTLAGVGPLRVALDVIRLRWRYGAWPPLGMGLLARLRGLVGGGTRAGAEPYPYPPWLDPAFERRLGLQERWQEFWGRRPSPRNPRHPMVHEGLVEPDWSLGELFLHPGFTMPEIRDPFLDLRLIAFVLALPPLPWTFRKHLLRQCMAGALPAAVLGRAKTPLGELHRALLAQPQANWVDAWRPDPGLGAYVQAAKIPPLRGKEDVAGQTYVNLRPLLLGHWIGTVERELGADLS